jgi:hypothetical protein
MKKQRLRKVCMYTVPNMDSSVSEVPADEKREFRTPGYSSQVKMQHKDRVLRTTGSSTCPTFNLILIFKLG